MNNNLFIKEFKRNLKELLIVGPSLIFFISLSMTIYSTMEDNMSVIMELYKNIPEAIQEALNFNDNQWSTVLGFYVTYFVYYVPMGLGIYAIYLGSKILSQEEQNKTAEFLLTRPLSRDQIILSKLLVLYLNTLIINLLLYACGVISCGIISAWEVSFEHLTIIHIYGLMICLFFGTLGFFITVIMKKAKLIMGAGIGIIMGSYVIDMILRVSDKAQFLLYLTPFNYMNVNVNFPGYGFEAWRVFVLLIAIIIMIVLSLVFYRKKDILI